LSSFCGDITEIELKLMFSIAVEVEMYGEYGFISAVDMPLLVVSIC
jgi:hypothetical protein